jgi:Ca2+/Na+ antiporter
MVLAAVMLFWFLTTGATLSKKEALFLLGFWILFIITESLINQ